MIIAHCTAWLKSKVIVQAGLGTVVRYANTDVFIRFGSVLSPTNGKSVSAAWQLKLFKVCNICQWVFQMTELYMSVHIYVSLYQSSNL